MAGNKVSSLTLELVDRVSAGARSVERALADAEKQVRNVATAMGEDSGASERLVANLSKLNATSADIAAVSKAWREYSSQARLAGDASQWTREAAAGVRAWETSTINSVKQVIRERQNESAAMRNIAREQEQIQRTAIERQVTLQKEAAVQRKEMMGRRRRNDRSGEGATKPDDSGARADGGAR
jgi:hypothetical protein